jgi:hypothetical protein
MIAFNGDVVAAYDYDDEYDEDEEEEDPYIELREVLKPAYAHLSPAGLERALGPEYADSLENFARDLKNFSRAVAPVAQTVAQYAAPALQSGALGPYGMVAGGILNAIQPTQPGAVPAQPQPGASAASAASLLSLLQRPEVLNALLALAAGPAGQTQVNVSGTAVPVKAIANAVGALANQAAASDDPSQDSHEAEGAVALAHRLISLDYESDDDWTEDEDDTADLDAFYDALESDEVIETYY